MTNYWLILLLLAGPAIVFSVKPEAAAWKRDLRIVIAIVVCYVLINLAWMLHSDIKREAYETCVATLFPHSASYHLECGDQGLDKYILWFGGWFFSVAFVGYCEIAWIIHHRKRIVDTGFISFLLLLACVSLTGLLMYLMWQANTGKL